MQLITIKDGLKAIPRPGGTGKNPGGILLMSITTKTYPALIDQGNLIEEVIGTLIRGTVQNSVTADGSPLSPTGGVNTKPPIQKNGYGNFYVKTMATV